MLFAPAPALSAPFHGLFGAMNPVEAGELIRSRREARGLKQEQVAERLGINNPNYVSYLEKGKVNVARSKYFAPLARLLRLSEDDVRSINPDAIVSQYSEPESAEIETGDAGHVGADSRIPAGLLEAAEQFGTKFPALTKRRVQEQLASARFFDGVGPQTAAEWRDYYTSVARWVSDKD
jgi:transcriptional regulator with XRE-family HTH domain